MYSYELFKTLYNYLLRGVLMLYKFLKYMYVVNYFIKYDLWAVMCILYTVYV